MKGERGGGGGNTPKFRVCGGRSMVSVYLTCQNGCVYLFIIRFVLSSFLLRSSVGAVESGVPA